MRKTMRVLVGLVFGIVAMTSAAQQPPAAGDAGAGGQVGHRDAWWSGRDRARIDDAGARQGVSCRTG